MKCDRLYYLSTFNLENLHAGKFCSSWVFFKWTSEHDIARNNSIFFQQQMPNVHFRLTFLQVMKNVLYISKLCEKDKWITQNEKHLNQDFIHKCRYIKIAGMWKVSFIRIQWIMEWSWLLLLAFIWSDKLSVASRMYLEKENVLYFSIVIKGQILQNNFKQK